MLNYEIEKSKMKTAFIILIGVLKGLHSLTLVAD